LSLKVAKAINVTLEEAKLGSQTDTPSLDAMMAYSDGLTLLEQGTHRAAYEKFLKAREYDPSYKQAQLKAKSIKPMLALAEAGAETSGDTKTPGEKKDDGRR